MTVTKERRKIFEFSLVYINNRQVIVIRGEDASTDLRSLTEVKISAETGSVGEDLIRKINTLKKQIMFLLLQQMK